MSRKAHTIGRLVLTTCRQGARAPILDPATVHSDDGWRAGAWAVRIPRRDLAVVIGWRGARSPRPLGWRRRQRQRLRASVLQAPVATEPDRRAEP